jgi:hypothetical protein
MDDTITVSGDRHGRGPTGAAARQSVIADYLRESDELGHEQPPGVSRWSENYLSGACFPSAGAGVWLHQSRPAHDPRFWEEVFSFALPGDRCLYAKGATLAPGPGHAAVGPALTYQCLEPFRTWRKSFHGLAQLVTGEQARAGALRDGPHLAVDMDLTWECVGPAFDMDMSEQVWADVKAHYQQHGRVSGSIAFGNERLELDGFGIRDHSWGPRDLSGLGNHTWIYGEFPSGRRIMYFWHLTPEGHGRLDVGHEAEGDNLRPLRLAAGHQPPVPRPARGYADPYEIALERSTGEIATLRGEILATIPLGLASDSEVTLGAAGEQDSHHLFECPSRLEWDGETGYGITEWTWRTDMTPGETLALNTRPGDRFARSADPLFGGSREP